MIVWKEWRVTKKCFGVVERDRIYKLLLLFGIIPIFIYING